jgi:hypothetical protein
VSVDEMDWGKEKEDNACGFKILEAELAGERPGHALLAAGTVPFKSREWRIMPRRTATMLLLAWPRSRSRDNAEAIRAMIEDTLREPFLGGSGVHTPASISLREAKAIRDEEGAQISEKIESTGSGT